MGAQQRVEILKALYRGAELLVLDEPTAALDPLAEAEIYENFGKLVKGKTACTPVKTVCKINSKIYAGTVSQDSRKNNLNFFICFLFHIHNC